MAGTLTKAGCTALILLSCAALLSGCSDPPAAQATASQPNPDAAVTVCSHTTDTTPGIFKVLCGD